VREPESAGKVEAQDGIGVPGVGEGFAQLLGEALSIPVGTVLTWPSTRLRAQKMLTGVDAEGAGNADS
jgi:hypothetical protein